MKIVYNSHQTRNEDDQVYITSTEGVTFKYLPHLGEMGLQLFMQVHLAIHV